MVQEKTVTARKIPAQGALCRDVGAAKNKKMRVAVYCRVSTQEGMQEESFELQKRAYIQKIAMSPQYELADIYGDYGISGGSIQKREAFKRMLNDCRSGRIDLIMTKSISRFARNLSDSLNAIRELKSLGIPVLFEKENLHTMDSSGEILLSILFAMAQEEINAMSQNVKWSLRKKCLAGYPAVHACYGYRKHKEDQKLVWEIYEPEARRVRLAFFMAEQEKKYWEICEALQQMEDKENTGFQWCYVKVHNMLRHEAYQGDVLAGKYVSLDYLNKKEVRNKGFADQYYIEGHHEGIVSRQQFRNVQEIMGEGRLRAAYGELPQRWKRQFIRNRKPEEK